MEEFHRIKGLPPYVFNIVTDLKVQARKRGEDIKHLIELGTAIILMTALAALHRPLFLWLDRLSHTPVAQVRWQAVLVSIALAMVIITIQWVFFNDPTAQVLT